MRDIQYIEFAHVKNLDMDDIFRYLVDRYKTCGLMPFIGGYETTIMPDKIFHYRVTVILINK